MNTNPVVVGRRYNLVRREFCVSCKAVDHNHVNCPKRKRCYLCRKEGHVAADCDHLMRRGMQEASLKLQLGKRRLESPPFYFSRARETGNIHTARVLEMKSPMLQGAKIDQILTGALEKRVTSLSCHPTERGVLLVGDKRGNLLLCKYMDNDSMLPREKHSTTMNRACFCQINEIVHDQSGESVFLSSSDGRLQRVYHERGMGRTPALRISDERYDSNPDADGWNKDSRMLYGLDFDKNGRHGLYAGDHKGFLHVIDPRASAKDALRLRIHKQKITHVHINHYNVNLMVTSGNDRLVKIWDTRTLSPVSPPVGQYTHEGVVSSAYFSPNSGSKLLSTSQDNKLRIWNDVNAFGCKNNGETAPDTTIIHAHNFFRYLSPFKAVWDPKDWRDDLFMCGRYLTEMYDGIPVAPLDLFSSEKGCCIGSLFDNAGGIKLPLNLFSPWEGCDESVVSGASRDIFIWRPAKDCARIRGAEQEASKIFSPSKKTKLAVESEKARISKLARKA